MKLKFIVLSILLIFTILHAQNLTPLEKSGYKKLTSHTELIEYLKDIAHNSKLIAIDTLTKSVEGRLIPCVKISKGEFGKDKKKLKLLIFAQQHGNEQSGKEGALLLINELLKKEKEYLLNKIDFAIVPQMNPDGSEKNQRRNGNNMDLNRNHLILTEPETIGLHRLFNKYLFEVTMDVHEYYPYSDSYKKYGYRNNADEEVGALTNINVSEQIRSFSDNLYIPFIKKYFTDRNFSFFVYSPGGPPGIDYIRRSTFDINDGRQSFGIQNTFSFIQEGLNGKDNFIDNIEHRAKGQMTGMIGLIEFSYKHSGKIKSLVRIERKKLTENKTSDKIAIQLDHVSNGTKLQLPLVSYNSGKDTIVTVEDYRPVVKSLQDVERPKGYLVPKKLSKIIEWANNHSIEYSDYKKASGDKIEQYQVTRIDSMDFERDIIATPVVEVKEIPNTFSENDYLFIPINQLRNNLIVIALEPKSELGLVTYNNYSSLLKVGEAFPILRVVNKFIGSGIN